MHRDSIFTCCTFATAFLTFLLPMSPAGAQPVEQSMRGFQVELSDVSDNPRVIRAVIRDLEFGVIEGSAHLGGVISTSVGITFNLRSSYLPGGRQTHFLSDGRGDYYQLVLSETEFLALHTRDTTSYQKQISVSGEGNLLAMIAEIAATEDNRRTARRAYSGLPMHRILIASLQNINAPGLTAALKTLEQAIILQTDAIAPQNPPNPSEISRDEWDSLNSLNSREFPDLSAPLLMLPIFLDAGKRVLLDPVPKTPPETRGNVACEIDAKDDARQGTLTLPLPTIADINVDGMVAHVHAKCKDQGCLGGSSSGNISFTPFASVPKCDEIYKNGSLLFSLDVSSEASVNVKKGDCYFEEDDFVQIASIRIKPAASPPVSISAVQQQGNYLCAGTAARVDIKMCYGRTSAQGTAFPLMFNQTNHDTKTNCDDPKLPPKTP